MDRLEHFRDAGCTGLSKSSFSCRRVVLFHAGRTLRMSIQFRGKGNCCRPGTFVSARQQTVRSLATRMPVHDCRSNLDGCAFEGPGLAVAGAHLMELMRLNRSEGLVATACLSAFVVALLVGPTGAVAVPTRDTVFDLTLGLPLSDQPRGFRQYACGSEGGAPGARIQGWQDFSLCAPEPSGLHEVYFEYNDVAGQAARRAGDPVSAWGLGTSLDYFPIVTSALFDDNGVLRRLRIVTDPRPEQRKDPFMLYRPRGEHYLLQLYLMDRFGMQATDCRDLPLEAGQSPVFGMVTNRVCDKIDAVAKRHYHIEARFYRRRGEHDVDPDTGQASEGQFVSETRAEIRTTAG
jgi:hypothetical protein